MILIWMKQNYDIPTILALTAGGWKDYKRMSRKPKNCPYSVVRTNYNNKTSVISIR